MVCDSWFSGAGSRIRDSGSLNSQGPIRFKRIFRHIILVRLSPGRGIFSSPGQVRQTSVRAARTAKIVMTTTPSGMVTVVRPLLYGPGLCQGRGAPQ